MGSWSDNVSSRWGRRKPFIVAGIIGLTLSILTLAWTRELITGSKQVDVIPSTKLRTAVICFATFWIYALNVAIQPVQAGIRSLIVEYCPNSQQSQASTYASVMQGIGNIVGYLFAFGVSPYISSGRLIPFQILAIFASTVLSATVAISCLTISEEPCPPLESEETSNRRPLSKLRALLWTYRDMPRNIRKVFHVQFLAWMGWFPFLYYSTTYVGEFYAGKRIFTYLVMHPKDQSGDYSDNQDPTPNIAQEAIRYGTFASFLFAVVTFTFNLILSGLLACFSTSRCPKHAPLSKQEAIVQAWRYSHLLFALLMFSTLFVHSEAAATAIVALAGLSWALTLFAPFAILGYELAPTRRSQRRRSSSQSTESLISSSEGEDANDEALIPAADQENRTGAIIGLHNVAISLPQILAALACSAIYAAAKALHISDGTGWVLRAGGLAALGAAWLCAGFDEQANV